MTNEPLRFRKFSEVVSSEAKSLIDSKARMDRGEQVLLQIPTGLRDLDLNGGLELGVLTVIAAPTGEGKSALKLHLARSAARAGLSVVSLDFEDPAAKTAHRSIAGESGLAAFKLGRLAFTEEDGARIMASAISIEPWGRLVDTYAGLLTAAQVRQALDQFPDAKLVMVDYAQALPGLGGSLEREIAELAWDLGADAQKRGRAIVVFSQTIPQIEERGARRFERDGSIEGYRPGPGKSYISWARALAERAKAVWYLFRPGRWGRKHGLDMKDDRMDIIVDKANFGLEGVTTVGWDGAASRLYDLPRKGA